jgi:stage V sporulation protein AE
MSGRKKVILVTDGDTVAQRAVAAAARNLGIHCISLSGGHPTPINGEEIVRLVQEAVCDPVVVMFDDRGRIGQGKGEAALEYLARHPGIEILGALAVASNTERTRGLPVRESMARNGEMVSGPVDKYGNAEEPGHRYQEGDTIEVLNRLKIPNVIGIGDIGKMDFSDDPALGAPITTAALREIMNRNGFH